MLTQKHFRVFCINIEFYKKWSFHLQQVLWIVEILENNKIVVIFVHFQLRNQYYNFVRKYELLRSSWNQFTVSRMEKCRSIVSNWVKWTELFPVKFITWTVRVRMCDPKGDNVWYRMPTEKASSTGQKSLLHKARWKLWKWFRSFGQQVGYMLVYCMQRWIKTPFQDPPNILKI